MAGGLREAWARSDFGSLLRLFERSQIPSALIGADSRVLYANGAFAGFVGARAAELGGRELRTLYSPDEPDGPELADVRAGRVEADAAERRFVRADGSARWGHVSFTAVPTANGERPVALQVHDITEGKDTLERLRTLVETAPVSMLVVDAAGRIEAVNPAAERLLGYSAEELAGRPVELLVPDLVRARHPALRKAFAGRPERKPLGGCRDLPTRRKDGTELPTEIGLSPLGDGRVQVVLIDLSECKRVQRELELRAAQQAAVAEFGERALEGAPVDELMQLACRLASERLGLEYAMVLEDHPAGEVLVLRAGVGFDPTLIGSATGAREHTAAGAALITDEPLALDDLAANPAYVGARLPRWLGVRSGITAPISARDRPYGALAALSRERRAFTVDEVNFLRTLANVLADALSREQAEGAVRRQALHDPLTGLPNRSLAMERLEHWLAGALRRKALAALLFVDLDRFKEINDRLGHRIGDELLRSVAARLRQVVRPQDTVARLGGDEFVVFCTDVDSEEAAGVIAERVLAAFGEPLPVAGDLALAVTPSIGVAVSGRPPLDGSTLMNQADTAMYRAKEAGRGRYEMFSERLQRSWVRRLSVARDLRRALDDGLEQLDLRYQPFVAIEGRALVGFEALVRWEHPRSGSIAPSEFIPIAEASGLIFELGEWVLRRAAEQAVEWRLDSGEHPAARVSVNLSPRQVGDPATASLVVRVLEETGLPAERLAFELPENALLSDVRAAEATLARLSEIGAQLALDDFGTGYSSLSHVDRFPIDVLKVDRAFTARVTSDRRARSIVDATVGLARGLGAEVIAEGVETEEQHACLAELGCPLAQGYLYARPLSEDAATRRLAEAASPPRPGDRPEPRSRPPGRRGGAGRGGGPARRPGSR